MSTSNIKITIGKEDFTFSVNTAKSLYKELKKIFNNEDELNQLINERKNIQKEFKPIYYPYVPNDYRPKEYPFCPCRLNDIICTV